MNKLMSKYTFYIHRVGKGYLHIVVTRLSDGATKYFYQAHGDAEKMTEFMNVITDELADGYFPRAGKKGGVPDVPVDNWAYLGPNPERLVAEAAAKELADVERTYLKLKTEV